MAKVILSFKVTENATGKPNLLQIVLEGDAPLESFAADGSSSLDDVSPGELSSVELQFGRHALKWEPELTTHIKV